MRNLVAANGSFLSWNDFKSKYNIDDKFFFKWIQLKNSIPKDWLNLINCDFTLSDQLCDFKSHLNNKAKMCAVDKLSSKVIYRIIISNISSVPTAQNYFEKFTITHSDWSSIYLLPRKITVDSYSRMFQYKILNNILFLNSKLFHSNLVDSPLCSLCLIDNETVEHLFAKCTVTVSLWTALKNKLSKNLILEDLSPQSAFFGFRYENADDYLIINHILLIFKIFLFKYRIKKPTLDMFFLKISNYEKLERQLCLTSQKHFEFHTKKWSKIMEYL